MNTGRDNLRPVSFAIKTPHKFWNGYDIISISWNEHDITIFFVFDGSEFYLNGSDDNVAATL